MATPRKQTSRVVTETQHSSRVEDAYVALDRLSRSVDELLKLRNRLLGEPPANECKPVSTSASPSVAGLLSDIPDTCVALCNKVDAVVRELSESLE